jgi:hypothetical protein
MLLLKSLTTLISLVALFIATRCNASASIANATTNTSVVNADRHHSLQGAAACLASKPFTTCCPKSMVTDDSNSICTLLYCLQLGTGTMLIRNSCKCGQLVAACRQVLMFSFAVPNLGGMCNVVDGCCGASTGVGAWNTCIKTEIDGGLKLPNWATLIPGGVPNLDAAKPTRKPTKKPTRKPMRKPTRK